jgi:hypothetical protein
LIFKKLNFGSPLHPQPGDAIAKPDQGRNTQASEGLLPSDAFYFPTRSGLNEGLQYLVSNSAKIVDIFAAFVHH